MSTRPAPPPGTEGVQLRVRTADGRTGTIQLTPGVRVRLGTLEVWLPEPEPPAPAPPDPIDEPDDDTVTAPRVTAPQTASQLVETPLAAPRSPEPAPPPAPHPPRVPEERVALKHPDDEDYDDELDFVVPFDLAGQLRALPASKARKGRCVASVLQFDGSRVRHLGLVPTFQAERMGDGPWCASEGDRVVVTWPPDAREVQGGSPTEQAGTVTLCRGESTVGTIGERAWRVTAIRPSGTPLMLNLPRAVGAGLLLGISIVASMISHGMLGLGVQSLAVLDAGALVEEVQEEQFAEVEMRIEEPPEVVERKQTLTLSEKAPTVSREQVTQASEMPRSENTSVSSLLTRLAASEASAAGLAEGISNIDAVAASSSTNTAFNLAGRLSASSGVKVARSGTGAVNTSGQVGEGVGKLNAGARKGVRGRVTKLSSRMKVRGTLDPAQVTSVVNANMGAIQACYERQMMKEPGLAGRVQFEWTIATNGTVRGVRVQSSTLPSDVVANCVSAEIKTWRFPPPTGGEAVISYPFAFRSG